MKDGDLTPRQLAVLVTVAGNEGLSQTGLVERTGIDRSTLADIVRRMQRKGLLQRRRTREDARAYAVKLTDEGRRLLRVAEPLAKRVDERILDALPTKQREQFVDDLLSIVDTLQKLCCQTDILEHESRLIGQIGKELLLDDGQRLAATLDHAERTKKVASMQNRHCMV